MLPGQLLVPELEGHLGARTCRLWREEGDVCARRAGVEEAMETNREPLSFILDQAAILDMSYEMGTKNSNLPPKEAQGEIGFVGNRPRVFIPQRWPPWSWLSVRQNSASTNQS